MITLRPPLFLLFLLCGCATVDRDAVVDELPYECSDLVVVGRMAAVEEAGAADSEGWQSLWQMQVRIKRIVHGTEKRMVVPARAISHGQIRDDIDFLAVLRPDGDGSYSLTTAAIWNANPRPKLARNCA